MKKSEKRLISSRGLPKGSSNDPKLQHSCRKWCIVVLRKQNNYLTKGKTDTSLSLSLTWILCKDSRDVGSNFIVLIILLKCKLEHVKPNSRIFGSRGIWGTVCPIYVVKSFILWWNIPFYYINRVYCNTVSQVPLEPNSWNLDWSASIYLHF